jgi:hypothetical protein
MMEIFEMIFDLFDVERTHMKSCISQGESLEMMIEMVHQTYQCGYSGQIILLGTFQSGGLGQLWPSQFSFHCFPVAATRPSASTHPPFSDAAHYTSYT